MHYHTIIIGAGSMGMPTSYFSAKNGHKTLLIDTYEPPHTFGTHHGDTRIIRYAYGEGAQYVPLALRAATLFTEAEHLTKRKLLEEVGVLNIGKEDTDFMQNVFKSAERFQLPIEKLSTSDIEKRWTGINLVHNEIGAYEPNAGFLHVEECVFVPIKTWRLKKALYLLLTKRSYPLQKEMGM
ncbi:FAD dependent oxidoreductase family protein [Kurthia sp. 11kri321]|uniref:FAD-dependent oxidoreductase n=1 Tax=Kurthia sp. 11kri321 TaxID=1750719 RepID=UPI000745EF52|nr:FAD-dependent oxidoreductase [Kurthia sp. 11kri321]AMA62640.1 FAD dependent oxidoreductase family protein [Kurthia sp. 11kri321]